MIELLSNTYYNGPAVNCAKIQVIKGILKSVLESNYNYCETPNKFNNLET